MAERPGIESCVLRGTIEMTLQESKLERSEFKLPASSWWIPSITVVIVALALVTALA